MVNLNLTENKKEVVYTETANNESNYEEWRKFQKTRKKSKKDYSDGFFMAPGRLVKYLPSLTDRALNLYLYYGIRSNSKTGKTWVSTETCAKDLSVTTRSINTWNEKLIKLGLIARVDENQSSKSTYLLPLESFAHVNKSTSPQKYNETSDTDINGPLIDILHLFQWRKSEPDSDIFDVPYSIICLVYRRSHILKDNGENKNIYKVVGFENIEDTSITIDKKFNEFEKNIYRFTSEFKLEKSQIETKGMAITSSTNLKSPEELLSIAVQIVEGDQELILALPEVNIV